MKKLFISFLTSLATLSAIAGGNALQSTSATQGHDDPLDNGFILRFGTSVLSKNYGLFRGVEYSNEFLDEYRKGTPKLALGLELGSQWYFLRTASESMGFGINVNWLDFSVGSKKYEEVRSTFINLSLIELGPMFTYKLTDDMGVDIYFNAKPTTIGNFESFQNSSSTFGAFGLTYATGLSYRWRALAVGFEYNFGSVTPFVYKVEDKNYTDLVKKEKMISNAFKINIGVKL